MVQAIRGPNFSGKSYYLKCYSGFPIENAINVSQIKTPLFRDSRNDLYIGAIPDYFLSGFFDTVKSEIFRFKQNTLLDEPSIKEFINYTKLDSLYNRNPFTLSGGEKAIVSILSLTSSHPRSLSIDSTLEQLSLDWKKQLLNTLLNISIPEILLADNRIDEIPGSLLSEVDYGDLNEYLDPKFEFQNMISEKIIAKEEIHKQTIQLIDLTFSYGQNEIFKNLNLQLETGKIYHLKGKNGSGKSTLSKILCGVLKPNKKTNIFLNGNKINPFVVPGKYFGYAFQQPDCQIFTTKVRSELGMDNSSTFDNIRYKNSIIETFGLSTILEADPYELPLPIQKKLTIAATLCIERSFYIFDEPTLFLDDTNVSKLKEIIKKLVCAGKCVVLISHSDKFISLFDEIQTIDLNSN